MTVNVPISGVIWSIDVGSDFVTINVLSYIRVYANICHLFSLLIRGSKLQEPFPWYQLP